MKKITIAIDGYSSCGKSTMAKDLAREIGYIYIDSGAMYGAVTLYSLQKGFFSEKGIDTEALKTAMPDIHISFRLNPETQRPMTFLNDTNVEDAIRSMEVSSHVSPIAIIIVTEVYFFTQCDGTQLLSRNMVGQTETQGVKE